MGWAALPLTLLAAWTVPAWAQPTPAITFSVAPDSKVATGDAAQLRAHWNRARQASWLLMFQYRRGDRWITLPATDGLGNPLRGADGKPHLYVCEEDDCRLSVNPSLTGTATLEFRLLVVDSNSDAQQAGTHVERVTWEPRRPGGRPGELVLRITTGDAVCEVRWRYVDKDTPSEGRKTCRSALDGPPAADSAQVKLDADGSAPPVTATATWEGFDNLDWGWTVRISFGTFQGQGRNACPGIDRGCPVTIPARPKDRGPAAGREHVSASIGWDGRTGPGNPNGRPPAGMGLDGLTVEQGIDYRK